MSISKKFLLIAFLFIFAFFVQVFFGHVKADETERKILLTGLDVLKKSDFEVLKGKSIGLITNHTAFDQSGDYILDIFSKSNKFKLKAIFTPEHGLRGKEDKEFIPSEVYGEDIPVHSLYGKLKKPSPEMLKGIDLLIFDIQDIGTRYYTYITTMAYAMEAAAENKIGFMVLDRPNPIGGEIIEGEILDPRFRSFTGYLTIPTRHAMTVGEIASYYKKTALPDLDLNIIKMENWKRDMWFEDSFLKWTNPSPNMRSMNAAILYPGLGTLETTNFSVGRGTESPFTVYGAPWLDNQKLVKALNARKFPGLKFHPITFVPDSSVYANEKNYGFRVEITDRNKVRSFDALIYTVYYINKFNPGKLKENGNNGIIRSFGSGLLRDLLDNKISPEELINKVKKHQKDFLEIRQKYLLY